MQDKFQPWAQDPGKIDINLLRANHWTMLIQAERIRIKRKCRKIPLNSIYPKYLATHYINNKKT